ncbi:hypothetical protein NUU61_002317 [Penicillium alfredii]|uniref:Uncharacterized protein n=1 Tax=Penicillium alfredii TaxID=1506179 RepID=A0A9W9KFW6_9EURO|nr:uncharacterized protein NUU61_002317 [Penicillium alfredii]KAJ5104970.1 hypothetical protein NUU61_002317 [Penicillium alfredii]
MADFKRLPLEIIQIITSYLDTNHPPSLVGFACTNNFCYAAAAPFLFHTLNFPVEYESSFQDIAERVQTYTRSLQRVAGFQYVHRVMLHHPWPESKRNAMERGHATDREVGNEQNLDARLDTFLDGLDYILYDAPGDIPGINEAWKPLADLIRSLPALADLLYSCAGQFPPCLLDALHESQSLCRLHLYTFGLWDFGHQLATSPCLHSITVLQNQSAHISGQDSEYTTKTVMRMAAKLAPNLKHVHLWQNPQEPDAEWTPSKGLGQDSTDLDPGTTLGSLDRLQFSGFRRNLTKRDFDLWRQYTDFSTLKELKIDTQVEGAALNALAATPNAGFPCLQTLDLTTSCDSPLEERHTFYKTAERFLLSLPPLSALLLRPWHSEFPLASVLRHHNTLEGLTLPALQGEFMTESQIDLIKAHSQHLRHLEIMLHRTDAHLCKKLGSMPRLQSLDLELDPSDRWGYPDKIPPTKPNLSEYDQQACVVPGVGEFRVGWIRDALINSAVDQTLACAFFVDVSAGKMGAGSLGLERLCLKVRSVGGLVEYGDDFQGVVNSLNRSWLVERNPRDDCQNIPVVKDRGQFTWFEEDTLPPWLVPIFRSIWPETSSGSCWKDDWHSPPLVMTI